MTLVYIIAVVDKAITVMIKCHVFTTVFSLIVMEINDENYKMRSQTGYKGVVSKYWHGGLVNILLTSGGRGEGSIFPDFIALSANMFLPLPNKHEE